MLAKLMLLLTALLLTASEYSGEQVVLPFLLTLILLALNEFFRKRRLAGALFCLLALACPLLPPLLLFLPLAGYDLLARDSSCAVLLAGLLSVLLAPPETLSAVTILLFHCLLTVCTRALTARLATAEQQLRENRDQYTEKSRLTAQRIRLLLRDRAADTAAAQRDERARIAREIHDGVGHRLSSALLQVGALQVIPHDAALDENLGALHDTLEEAMNAIRCSVHDLRDRSVSLYDSLYALQGELGGCRLTLRYELDEPPPPALAHTMLAITQEAFANLMRHSDATAVEVVVAAHPALYQLIITDNGTKPPPVGFRAGSGMGLENIRVRAEAFGGAADFRFENGFRVFASFRR